MMYELWDTESGNAIGAYATLNDALRVVRDAFIRNGESTLTGLTLLEVAEDGESRMVAEEQALLELAQRSG